MKQAKLIRKLRLKKGCKYILFIPDSANLDNDALVDLSDAILDEGFQSLIVKVASNKGIKVIEQ